MAKPNNLDYERGAEAVARIIELHKEIGSLKALLVKLEWSEDMILPGRCPSCKAWKGRGHTPECEIRATLG